MGAEPDMLDQSLVGGTESDELGGSRWVDPVAAREVMYGDCSDEESRWAFDQLRLQAAAPYAEVCSLDVLPEVQRTYILCTEDRLVMPDWSRQAARERLGVNAIEIPGSHSPFLSRPGPLASLLIQSAEGTAAAASA